MGVCFNAYFCSCLRSCADVDARRLPQVPANDQSFLVVNDDCEHDRNDSFDLGGYNNADRDRDHDDAKLNFIERDPFIVAGKAGFFDFSSII